FLPSACPPIPGYGANYQGGKKRHHPAGLGAAQLDTVKKDLRPPPLTVGLDAELVDLLLNLADQFGPLSREFLAIFRRATDDMKRPPGQHARHRVQIGRVDIAAQSCRLERNLAGTAEGVGEPW